MVQAMRTAAQCLVKAAEMERLSDSCQTKADAGSYEMMAADWRGIARLAARQDQFPH
jgi:hypothetical protein